MNELADHGARMIADAVQPYVAEEALVPLPTAVPAMRLIRLPDGLGKTREEADALRMTLFDRVGVETAFTSFEGRGYYRMSVHLYTEVSDFEAYIERCIPEILRAAAAS